METATPTLSELKPPTTPDEAVAVIEALEWIMGGGFHLDTPAADYTDPVTATPFLTEAAAVEFDALIEAVFAIADDPANAAHPIADPYAVSYAAYLANHDDETPVVAEDGTPCPCASPLCEANR